MVVGACMVAGGMCGCRGRCVTAGGMHGYRGDVHGCGGCLVAGVCAWLWGVCMGYDEIRSMSSRYASYWNAFLFLLRLLIFHVCNSLDKRNRMITLFTTSKSSIVTLRVSLGTLVC